MRTSVLPKMFARKANNVTIQLVVSVAHVNRAIDKIQPILNHVKVYFVLKFPYLLKLDVDECKEEHHNCDSSSSNCSNTDGSYICECKTGWQNRIGLDNICIDVDECDTKPCKWKEKCLNSDGSFKGVYPFLF